MTFETIDNATLREWHAEALAAMQRLVTGGQVTSASYSQGTGSRSVSYAGMDQETVRQRIAALEAEMFRRGLLAVRPTRRRAIGIRF